MRDHLILLPGWGLGSAPLEPLRDALHEREPHLNVLIEPLPSLAAAEALLEWLPDVEVSTLAASHGLPLECPDEVAGAILRFLREGDDA